jgi:hypothetical protein
MADVEGLFCLEALAPLLAPAAVAACAPLEALAKTMAVSLADIMAAMISALTGSVGPKACKDFLGLSSLQYAAFKPL